MTDLNAELVEIWKKKFEADSDVYLPMAYPPLKPGGLLFVGINPSFSAEGWESILGKGWPGETIDPARFFHWKNRKNYNLSLSCDLEAFARKHYRFYEPYRKLASEIRCDWAHLDLFAIRETKQELLRGQVLAGEFALNDFGSMLFSVFERQLEILAPRAVVVANALASNVYRDNRKLEFDKRSGCYLDRIAGVDIPVFFSGMLGGQRSLDRFSAERLRWHVDFVLNGQAA